MPAAPVVGGRIIARRPAETAHTTSPALAPTVGRMTAHDTRKPASGAS